MKKPQRRIDRAAVAKSLRELALLFGGIKPPATKDKSRREAAFIGAANSELQANDSTVFGGAQ